MKNKYKFLKDSRTVEILFPNGDSFFIDREDFVKVSAYTWHKGKRGYPIAHTSRKDVDGHKTITLHRYLLGFPQNCDIDHIDGNKMNNRRSNLLICSHQQNSFNQKMRNTNTSGYYGVSQMKSCGRYEAYIHVDGKKKYLGLYKTAEEAAQVRDDAAIIYFGKFAKLNFEHRRIEVASSA